MSNANEIQALIQLIDDPDDTIFNQIREKIISFGNEVIPFLEEAWEDVTLGSEYQTRIEDIIQTIHYDSLYHRLNKWKEQDNPDLLEGALIINSFRYPDQDENGIREEISKIRQNIWLELRDDLTSFEIVRIFNHVLFDIFGFHGDREDYHSPLNSYIGDVLSSKKGNPLSLSLVYAIVAQQLDIPIKGVNLPSHFVLAYEDEHGIMSSIDEDTIDGIMFYINPFSNGTIFNKREIESFLKKINLDPEPRFFKTCNNRDIVYRMITNLIYGYEQQGKNKKAERLEELRSILK